MGGIKEKRDPPFGKRRDIDCDYFGIRVILCGMYRPSPTSCTDQTFLQGNVEIRTCREGTYPTSNILFGFPRSASVNRPPRNPVTPSCIASSLQSRPPFGDGAFTVRESHKNTPLLFVGVRFGGLSRAWVCTRTQRRDQTATDRKRIRGILQRGASPRSSGETHFRALMSKGRGTVGQVAAIRKGRIKP